MDIISMRGLFCALFYLASALVSVSGSYVCMCTSELETPVYEGRSNSSRLIGTMYEYDCKPTFSVDDAGNTDYITIQYSGQIGYVVNKPGYLTIESCPGSVPLIDKVVSTTTNMAPGPTATSRKMSVTSTTSPNQAVTVPVAVQNSDATSRASFIVSATSTLKTTYKTTTEKVTPPTTTSKRTPEPSITLILTKTPPTTTSRPTTTPTTTMPTTTSTTPTTTSTTPTTTSTTPTTTSTTPTTTSTTPTTTSTTPTTTTTRRPTTTTSKPTTPPTTVTKTTAEKLIATCPHGWVIHENNCYNFHLDHQKHPEEARTMCEKAHSHLVHINTKDEQHMIEQYLQHNQDYQNVIHNSDDASHDSAILTGGVVKNGHVEWKDTYINSTTPITYRKWNHWYPHHSHDGNEYVIAMIGSEDYTWRDFRPIDTFYFICERSVTYQAHPPSRVVTASTTSGKDHNHYTHTNTVTTTTQTTKATTTQQAHHGGHINTCPSGWFLFESSCYSFHLTNRHPHTYSVNSCHGSHAELVSINSKEEQEMIFHHIRSIPEYRHELERFHDIHDVAIWMGAEYVHGHHFWQWTDTHHRMEYTNWSKHYPYHHLNSGSCAAFIGQHGHWRDFDCVDEFFYICEKPATRQPALIG